MSVSIPTQPPEIELGWSYSVRVYALVPLSMSVPQLPSGFQQSDTLVLPAQGPTYYLYGTQSVAKQQLPKGCLRQYTHSGAAAYTYTDTRIEALQQIT